MTGPIIANSSESGYFHVFNKSIKNFNIFNSDQLKERFLKALIYYNAEKLPRPHLAKFLLRNTHYKFPNVLHSTNASLVKVMAYCIMPDHYHLLIRAELKSKISYYINIVENSYTRFFNIKFDRKGPLWQSRYKAVPIESDRQLLHVSRYIHLNPTTSSLVNRPEDWRYSSYNDYCFNEEILKIYIKDISIRSPDHYRKFVEDQIDYQKKLKKLKKHLI